MKHPKKLGQLAATAICGNDITSSCLYVSALAIVYAGQWTWLALMLVAAVLFLFRKIYGEVVGALPLNGGAYNVLLNQQGERLHCSLPDHSFLHGYGGYLGERGDALPAYAGSFGLSLTNTKVFEYL